MLGNKRENGRVGGDGHLAYCSKPIKIVLIGCKASRSAVTLGDSLDLVLLLDSVRVGAALGGVDQLVGL